MKFKVLLVGRNEALIKDCFMRTTPDLEFLFSSSIFDDILNHLKYYNPDILLFCMRDELPDTMKVISAVKRDKTKGRLPVAIVGSAEECNDFNRATINSVDLVLKKPITTAQIFDKIFSFLKLRAQEMPEAPANEPAAAQPAPEPVVEEAPEPEHITYGTRIVSRRKHILVVDDDSRMLKTIKRDLEDKYDIATAINGRVALKFLEGKTTDLILLDYEMPIQNGPEVLEKLRANSKTANIPVVFLTGVTERAKIMQVLAYKPQGYLIKPVDRIKLSEMITSILG